jgi:excisionase family DNA binding protein
LTSAFSGLRYALDTKIRSKLVLNPCFGEFSPKSALWPRDKLREQGLILWKGTETMADSREVMNIRQASQYLGVSPDTLYKYVGEQKIPAFKLGNRWRFKKSKLDQWMEEKSNQMEARSKKKPKVAVKAAGQP